MTLRLEQLRGKATISLCWLVRAATTAAQTKLGPLHTGLLINTGQRVYADRMHGSSPHGPQQELVSPMPPNAKHRSSPRPHAVHHIREARRPRYAASVRASISSLKRPVSRMASRGRQRQRRSIARSPDRRRHSASIGIRECVRALRADWQPQDRRVRDCDSCGTVMEFEDTVVAGRDYNCSSTSTGGAPLSHTQ